MVAYLWSVRSVPGCLLARPAAGGASASLSIVYVAACRGPSLASSSPPSCACLRGDAPWPPTVRHCRWGQWLLDVSSPGTGDETSFIPKFCLELLGRPLIKTTRCSWARGCQCLNQCLLVLLNRTRAKCGWPFENQPCRPPWGANASPTRTARIRVAPPRWGSLSALVVYTCTCLFHRREERMSLRNLARGSSASGCQDCHSRRGVKEQVGDKRLSRGEGDRGRGRAEDGIRTDRGGKTQSPHFPLDPRF